MSPRLQAVYLVRCDARSIEERARAIAVEQSVEMPVAAIEDDFVRSEIVGRVEAITERDSGLFEVRVSLAVETLGHDPGQLINMLSAPRACAGAAPGWRSRRPPSRNSAARFAAPDLQLAVKVPHPDKASLRRDIQDELSGFFRAAAKVPNRTASDPPGSDCIIVSRLRQEVEDCLKGE